MNVCADCLHFHLYDDQLWTKSGACEAPAPLSTIAVVRDTVFEDTKADTCPMFAPTKLVPRF